MSNNKNYRNQRKKTGKDYYEQAIYYQNDYNLANNYFIKACELEPHMDQYKFDYADFLFRYCQFRKAKQKLVELTNDNSNNFIFYAHLSNCYFALRRYKESLFFIEKAVQLNISQKKDPDYSVFLFYFGILNQLEDYRTVVEIEKKYNLLQKFRDLETKYYYDFFLKYTWALAALGEKQKLNEVCDGRNIKRGPNACNLSWAYYYYFQKNYREAQERINNIDKKKKYEKFSFFKGLVELSLQNTEKAIQHFQDETEDDPNGTKSFIQIANIYLNQGEYTKALDILNKVDNVIDENEQRPYECFFLLEKAKICYYSKEMNKKLLGDNLMSYIREELRKDEIRQGYTNKDIIEIYSKYLELNSYYYGYTLQDLIVYPKQLLGEGRTTKVYKGILKQEEEVAVKFYKLNKDFLINEQYTMNILEHIFLEVTSMEIINTRRNKYILPIKCVFYLNNRKFIYLITPLCKGGSLYQLLRNINLRRHINFEHQIIVMLKIAEAVHFFHHFSPPIKVNILKSKSILFKDVYSSTKRRVNMCLGNISHIGKIPTDIAIDSAYLSPEIIEKKDIIDEKSDIYSFGVLLWEMFSGKDPSLGLSSDEIIEKVKNKKFCLPIEEMSSFHQRTNEIATLAIECLNEDKDKRPSIEEIISILKVLPDEDILRDNLL